MNCKLVLVIFFYFSAMCLKAQTGIGTTTPNASAKLDVYSTNKGFLPPRISLTDIYDQSTISSPAIGLLVYCKGDTGLAAGYYYWNGNAWATIATAGGSGSFASSYLRGSRIATQSIAVGGVVAFTNIDNSAGNDISLNTTTGKITLAAGNTYRIRGSVPNFSGGQRPAFIWYNETTSSNIGSGTYAYNPGDAAALGAFGTTAELVITPNVSTVISFRLLSSLSSGSVTVGGNGDFSSTGSYPWFDVQVISGNAPVTGQSVDYAIASLSTNQSISAVGNVSFNTIQGAGITLTNGGFNLLANKTYKLEGSVGGSSTGYIYYAWVDATNTIIGGSSIGSVMKAGSAFSDSPQDKAVAIYTPTSNTTVYLRVLTISGTSVAYPSLATPAYSSTWATIQQVGSSAFVNPWVLSGSEVYNITGEVGVGNTAPNAKLDVRSSPTSTTDPGAGTIGLGTSSATAASVGIGALRYNTSTSRVEVSNGSAWKGPAGPIYAQFQANASQSFYAAGGKVSFPTTVINNGGITITGNNTITLPAGRIYRVDFNMGWTSMAGGWSRFAIYNAGTSTSISTAAHLEAVTNNGGYAGSGATTTFVDATSGSIQIDVRYVNPANFTTSLGDPGSSTSYPFIVIQAVD